ncbi:MAG: class I SAM-dependent methyltransferase [Patescibacteria group bacterium]
MADADNYNNFLVELVASQLNGKGSGKVLDFGAGTGTYAKMLSKKGVKIDCLEPDASLQKALKKDGFNVLKGSNELKANTYDLIYSLNVFEHIEDDFAEVAKLQKALKKGGRLVIYVPAYQILFSSMDKQVGHFRRYRAKRLRMMAEHAGININRLAYYDPIGFFAAFAYRLFGGGGVLNPKSVRLYDKYAFPFSKTLHPVTKKFIGKNAILVAEK